MMSRYGVWLDSLPLNEIDENIIITDIQEEPAETDAATYPRGYGDGIFFGRRSRRSLSVVVRFVVYEYNVTRRKTIMQKIVSWAKGGKYLTINDRPGQRLRVEVDSLPTITSALKWTQELSITFTAYAVPYWEEEAATVVNATNAAIYSAEIPGDADRAMVDAIVQASNTTVTVKVNKTTISLKDVSGTVEITHGDDGILRILSNDENILSKRTPESSDDLIAIPGQTNEFSVSGGTAIFSVRGVWA